MSLLYVGIDYSMTSPSMCVHPVGKFSIKKCTYYYTGPKTVEECGLNLNHIKYPKSKQNTERFDELSEKFVEKLSAFGNVKVLLEDYAMRALGRNFDIGENTGLLKFKLYKNGIPFIVKSPTEIKKFATGKGNANKESMYEAFKKEGGPEFTIKGKFGSPHSDLVDSYFMCKMLHGLEE